MENYILFLFIGLIIYLSFFSNISSFEWRNAVLNPKNTLQSIGYHKKSIITSLKNIIFFFIFIILGRISFYFYPNISTSDTIITQFISIIWILGILYSYMILTILLKILYSKSIDDEKKTAYKLTNLDLLSLLNLTYKIELPDSNSPYDPGSSLLDDRLIWFRCLIGVVFIFLLLACTFFSEQWDFLYFIPPILLLLMIYVCCCSKESIHYFSNIQKIFIICSSIAYIALFYIPIIEVSEEFIFNLINSRIVLNSFIIILWGTILLILLSVCFVIMQYYKYSKTTQEESMDQINIQYYLETNYSLKNCYSLMYLVDYFIFYGTDPLPQSRKKISSFIFKLFGNNIKYLDKNNIDWTDWLSMGHPRNNIKGAFVSENNKQFKFGKIKNDVFFYLLKNHVQGAKISIQYVFYVTGLLTLLLFPFATLFFIPLYIIYQFNLFILFINILPFFMIFYMSFCIYLEWNKYAYLFNNDKQWIVPPLMQEIIFQELKEFYNPMSQQVTVHFYSFPDINMDYMRNLIKNFNPNMYNKFRQRFPYQKKYINYQTTGE